MNLKLTRTQKEDLRRYISERERNQGSKVTRIRFLSDGDVRAYCENGYTYLVAPTAVLIDEYREKSGADYSEFRVIESENGRRTSNQKS